MASVQPARPCPAAFGGHAVGVRGGAWRGVNLSGLAPAFGIAQARGDRILRRMKNPWLAAAFCFVGIAQAAPDLPALGAQVRAAEAAFAATMEQQDLAAFQGFIAEEAVFFTNEKALRGREAVVAEWKRFFEAPTAPFSWVPETIEVLDSGRLALSSGPVYDRSKKLVARFTSIWRREDDGKWRVVFDKGSPVCP